MPGVISKLRVLVGSGVVVRKPEEQQILGRGSPVQARIKGTVFSYLDLLVEIVPDEAIFARGQWKCVEAIERHGIQTIGGDDDDGNTLVFGREPDLMGKESGPRNLQILNLATHRVEEISNLDGLFSPRWSPDGRWITALTLDQKIVMLFDVAHGHWQRLTLTSAADPVWSADSKAIYLHAFLEDREPILRVEVPSGTIQTVADLGNFHNGEAANYFFGGVTPRGEPLVQPRVGTGNLYSLDLKAP